MAFNESFLRDSCKEIRAKSIDDEFEIIVEYLQRAVAVTAEQTDGMFLPVDVEFYVHGSYANQTNIFFPSSLEICVEIRQTREHFPGRLKTASGQIDAGYFVENLPYNFTPRIFRDMLHFNLSKLVGERATLSNKTISFEQIGRVKHAVEITPCFSFVYQNQKGKTYKGILLYDEGAGRHIASFPALHARNGAHKDMATAGNFKRAVRLFKTLYAIYLREFHLGEPTTATGYFIECLLYNVPNRLYNLGRGGAFLPVFNKVLNYLLHCDKEDFDCQNHVWKLVGNAKEFWQYKHINEFLSNIIYVYKNFPSDREFLA